MKLMKVFLKIIQHNSYMESVLLLSELIYEVLTTSSIQNSSVYQLWLEPCHAARRTRRTSALNISTKKHVNLEYQ